MDWNFDDQQFDIDIDPGEPVFPLNIVCKLVSIQYWTLHDIIDEGLLVVQEEGRRKLLSHNDIRRLNLIKYLMEEEGVNIKGIKIILQLREEQQDED